MAAAEARVVRIDGRFEYTREPRSLIGKGACGECLRGRDTDEDAEQKTVAVKEIRERQLRDIYGAAATGRIVQTIPNEFAIQRGLQHPSIVRVLAGTTIEDPDVGRIHVMVQEFCNANDLRYHLLKVGKLPTKEMAALISNMSAALSYLHKRNIIHRDIKPENIFLHRTSSGSLVFKLGDFGLSRAVTGEDDLVATAVGSPLFMAPEIAERFSLSSGRHRRPDPSSEPFHYGPEVDLWSLGTVLFRAAIGENAFVADSKERMYEGIVNTVDSLNADFRLSAETSDTLSPDLRSVVGFLLVHLLRLNPAERLSVDILSSIGASIACGPVYFLRADRCDLQALYVVPGVPMQREALKYVALGPSAEDAFTQPATIGHLLASTHFYHGIPPGHQLFCSLPKPQRRAAVLTQNVPIPSSAYRSDGALPWVVEFVPGLVETVEGSYQYEPRELFELEYSIVPASDGNQENYVLALEKVQHSCQSARDYATRGATTKQVFDAHSSIVSAITSSCKELIVMVRQQHKALKAEMEMVLVKQSVLLRVCSEDLAHLRDLHAKHPATSSATDEQSSSVAAGVSQCIVQLQDRSAWIQRHSEECCREVTHRLQQANAQVEQQESVLASSDCQQWNADMLRDTQLMEQLCKQLNTAMEEMSEHEHTCRMQVEAPGPATAEQKNKYIWAAKNSDNTLELIRTLLTQILDAQRKHGVTTRSFIKNILLPGLGRLLSVSQALDDVQTKHLLPNLSKKMDDCLQRQREGIMSVLHQALDASASKTCMPRTVGAEAASTADGEAASALSESTANSTEAEIAHAVATGDVEMSGPLSFGPSARHLSEEGAGIEPEEPEGSQPQAPEDAIQPQTHQLAAAAPAEAASTLAVVDGGAMEATILAEDLQASATSPQPLSASAQALEAAHARSTELELENQRLQGDIDNLRRQLGILNDTANLDAGARPAAAAAAGGGGGTSASVKELATSSEPAGGDGKPPTDGDCAKCETLQSRITSLEDSFRECAEKMRNSADLNKRLNKRFINHHRCLTDIYLVVAGKPLPCCPEGTMTGDCLREEHVKMVLTLVHEHVCKLMDRIKAAKEEKNAVGTIAREASPAAAASAPAPPTLAAENPEAGSSNELASNSSASAAAAAAASADPVEARLMAAVGPPNREDDIVILLYERGRWHIFGNPELSVSPDAEGAFTDFRKRRIALGRIHFFEPSGRAYVVPHMVSGL